MYRYRYIDRHRHRSMKYTFHVNLARLCRRNALQFYVCACLRKRYISHQNQDHTHVLELFICRLFYKSGSFIMQSLSEHNLSIPLYTGMLREPFQETHCI